MTPGRASDRFKPYLFVLQREGLSHAQFSQKFVKGTITDYLLKAGLIQVGLFDLLRSITIHTDQLEDLNQKFFLMRVGGL